MPNMFQFLIGKVKQHKMCLFVSDCSINSFQLQDFSKNAKTGLKNHHEYYEVFSEIPDCQQLHLYLFFFIKISEKTKKDALVSYM